MSPKELERALRRSGLSRNQAKRQVHDLKRFGLTSSMRETAAVRESGVSAKEPLPSEMLQAARG
jgi:hypothetical protein